MNTPTTGAPSAHPLPDLIRLSINGVTPFWSHPNGLDERLAEAHAILTMLADRHDLIGEDVEQGDIRHEIQARAMEGVKTILALAMHHSDCAAVEHRRRRGAPGTATASRTAWDALVRRHEEIEAVSLDDTTDELIDEAGEIIGQIMGMPAPDAAAACWKLDYLLAADKGSTASYDAAYVEQAKADYRRFLTGEA